MADTHTTIDGETVDDIAFDHYGSHGGTTELVMQANRGLAAYPLALPAGLNIVLPLLIKQPTKPVRLYD